MMKASQYLTALLIFVFAIFTASVAMAVESRHAIEEQLAKPKVRGGTVYKTYCALCHGEKGDGNSRAAKLYNNSKVSLSIQSKNKKYLFRIIRKGGEALGKSAYMPMWKEELSTQQIEDVITYLDVVNDKIKRGEIVFKTNCILCHGVKGNGKGRAAHLFNPPPADLTRSEKNDEYKRMIIRYGGAAMGRSENMPIWGEQLSEQEINDVVGYLRTLLK